MNRPALISVFTDQRRTQSATRYRTSCGTHTLVRAPPGFFLRPCAQPSIRPAPHPSSGSSLTGTRSVVGRLGGPDGSWTGRQPPRSRRTLFANGRTPLAAAPVPHTDRKPALYPANAVLGCQPSLRQCSASALFACVLSVILTEERSLQFQLRQDMLLSLVHPQRWQSSTLPATTLLSRAPIPVSSKSIPTSRYTSWMTVPCRASSSVSTPLRPATPSESASSGEVIGTDSKQEMSTMP